MFNTLLMLVLVSVGSGFLSSTSSEPFHHTQKGHKFSNRDKTGTNTKQENKDGSQTLVKQALTSRCIFLAERTGVAKCPPAANPRLKQTVV